MIWQVFVGLFIVIALGIALFVGFLFLLMKVIPLLFAGLFWLCRFALHFVDWALTTILLPLFLFGFGGSWMGPYLVIVLALALLSTLRVIRDGRYNLGLLFSPLLLVLGGLAAVIGMSGDSYGGYGNCGGEYTGPNEGADPSRSLDDCSRSYGARFVANKRSKVVFDVSDPVAKTISFKNRKYMDELPYDLEARGYRMKRDD